MIVDLNQEDIKITYNFINKFLRQFDTPQEEDFWDKALNIKQLQKVRDKFKAVLKDA